MTVASRTQADLHEEYLMTRMSFKPQDFKFDMGRKQFDDLMVDEFNQAYGAWSLDELLLHPREAIRFCDDVRSKHRSFDLPDDIILRVIMQSRKNP